MYWSFFYCPEEFPKFPMQEKFGTKNTKNSTNPSLSIVYSITYGVSTHSRDKPNSILILHSTQYVPNSLKAQHSLNSPIVPLFSPMKSPIPQYCNTKDSGTLRLYPYHIITQSVINPHNSPNEPYAGVEGGYSSFHTLFIERVSK